ncbi:hypothetical protein BLNAU_19414 [Blattamonas nauphoetae]|uniref:SCP domain-containing protein n=1 Tax=Blattamonas nauphoetae TaxID=2049346 RepID=A0ABQ9X1M3_9EUKA|nr:hypothetical protein BLNAU_19414 [Blattamonas nauphoetae]
MYDVLRLPDQSDYDYSIALGRQALAITNKHRANKNKSPLLYWHPLMHHQCYLHDQYMATQTNISHDNREARCNLYWSSGGSGTCRENVLYRYHGTSTAYEGMVQWFNSEGHRKNIEEATTNAAAIAFHHASASAAFPIYGCQMFVEFGTKVTDDPYVKHTMYAWTDGLIVPQITGIQILENSGGSSATITAVGRAFITGTFDAVCTNPSGTEFKFTLTFSNTTQGSNTNVPIGSECHFPTPNGNPTVKSITATNPTTSVDSTELQIVGTNLLIAGTYTVVLKNTITLTFEGPTLTGSSTTLVKASGTDAVLAFSTTYKVTSITHSSGKTITHSSPNVAVPATRTHVIENHPKSYNVDPTYFILTSLGRSTTLAQSGPIKVDGTNVKYEAAHFTDGAWMDGVAILYAARTYTSPRAPSTRPVVNEITLQLNSDPNFLDMTLVGCCARQ